MKKESDEEFWRESERRLYCQNPAEATLQLFDTLKRHVEKILGPHLGGYPPNGPEAG